MVSVLISGLSGPGSSPVRGHCVVFLGKTLYSHLTAPWSGKMRDPGNEVVSCLVSSIGRALHRYLRSHVLNSRTSLFFSGFIFTTV